MLFKEIFFVLLATALVINTEVQKSNAIGVQLKLAALNLFGWHVFQLKIGSVHYLQAQNI